MLSNLTKVVKSNKVQLFTEDNKRNSVADVIKQKKGYEIWSHVVLDEVKMDREITTRKEYRKYVYKVSLEELTKVLGLTENDLASL